MQQIVSDGNGSEKNKMCVEFSLSNAKVGTQPFTKKEMAMCVTSD